nr:helicase [Rhodospirillales bacterium]
QRPEGEIWTDYVSGAMSAKKRLQKLNQLKELTQGDIGLLSNARCLSEGVDVPSLDGVSFIDPKGSQVDIVQAVGRAIRLSDDKSIGTIILPVFIQDGDDAEESIERSNFKPVWSVLNALKSHDEVLAFELNQLRTQMGRKGSAYSGQVSKVVIDLPITIDKSFAGSINTHLIEQTTSSWSFMFGQLEAYIDEHGEARPKSGFKTPDGYRLGSWISKQRVRKDTMSTERRERLEALPGWVWNAVEAAWEEGFAALKAYTEEHGEARPKHNFKTPDGYALGVWISTQRAVKDRMTARMTAERRKRLEALPGWVWNARK